MSAEWDRSSFEAELRFRQEVKTRGRRSEVEDSLYEFLKDAWRYIDPSTFTPGWPLEAVAEHLEAVVDGQIRRLLINIPPRTGKSSIISVAFPAWVWAQQAMGATSGPSVPILGASYATQLALRDSLRTRRLIESPWYQAHWQERFSLTGDQNTKSRFGNSEGGERLVTSVTAAVTGEGANIIIIDDPNAAQEAVSEANILATNDWWDTTMSTRLNDPRTGAFVVVQQRLSEQDLTGHILESEAENWTHLVLPMHYEADRSFVTSIGWKDPRENEGDLLWPERFGDDEVKDLERRLGSWGSAGQLEQRPEPKGGGIIKREWWKLWEEAAFPPMDFIMASLDTAFTEKEENDFSALTIWGVFTTDARAVVARRLDEKGRPVYQDRPYDEHAPNVMLMYAWAERLSLHDLVTKAVQSCRKLHVDMLLIENKAAGISVAQEIRRLHSDEDYGVQLHDPKSTDKMARLYSVQHLFEEGIVYAPDKKWAEQVISEVASFPKGKHDDLTDTVSQALRKLRDMGLLTRAQERTSQIANARKIIGMGDESPLYPV